MLPLTLVEDFFKVREDGCVMLLGCPLSLCQEARVLCLTSRTGKRITYRFVEDVTDGFAQLAGQYPEAAYEDSTEPFREPL